MSKDVLGLLLDEKPELKVAAHGYVLNRLDDHPASCQCHSCVRWRIQLADAGGLEAVRRYLRDVLSLEA